jgi:GTPase SAR1 family protein
VIANLFHFRKEAYRKSIVVDGELCAVSDQLYCRNNPGSPAYNQLEVLDTAGAEQFSALNEFYIKVWPLRLLCSCVVLNTPAISIQSGLGFILVFSLTQESTLREVENLRKQIHRIKSIPFHSNGTSAPISPQSSQSTAPSTRRPSPNQASAGHNGYLDPMEGVGFGSIPLVIVGTKSDLPHEREIPRETMMRLSTLWGVPFYETSAKKNWNVQEVFEDVIRQMRERYPDGNPMLGQSRSRKPSRTFPKRPQGGGGKCIIM